MRKLVKLKALCGLMLLCAAVVSVGVAGAQVQGPEEWSGHEMTQCEPVTHLSYYDQRNLDWQGVGNPDHPNGDNVYYVDTNPLADFQADGNYEDNPPAHECDGTPVLRTTAYVGVTLQGELWLHDLHKGYPGCSNDPGETRNPGCDEPKTGVYGGFYVATGDNSTGTGLSGGVANPFSEEGGGNLP